MFQLKLFCLKFYSFGQWKQFFIIYAIDELIWYFIIVKSSYVSFHFFYGIIFLSTYSVWRSVSFAWRWERNHKVKPKRNRKPSKRWNKKQKANIAIKTRGKNWEIFRFSLRLWLSFEQKCFVDRVGWACQSLWQIRISQLNWYHEWHRHKDIRLSSAAVFDVILSDKNCNTTRQYSSGGADTALFTISLFRAETSERAMRAQ